MFFFLIPVDKDPEQRTPECISKHPELREALYSLTPPRRAPWRPPPAPRRARLPSPRPGNPVWPAAGSLRAEGAEGRDG